MYVYALFMPFAACKNAQPRQRVRGKRVENPAPGHISAP